MTGIEGESRFRGDTPPQYPHLSEQGIPHAELVAAFRTLIRQHQEIQQEGIDGTVVSPEVVVRSVLEWYRGASEDHAETFLTLRYAWDTLAYDRYAVGSKEEHMAGESLSNYYHAPDHPSTAIALTDPLQVRVLDALAEAARVPHTKGQTTFAVPEKLRHYNRYLLSAEYEARLAQARAKNTR